MKQYIGGLVSGILITLLGGIAGPLYQNWISQPEIVGRIVVVARGKTILPNSDEKVTTFYPRSVFG